MNGTDNTLTLQAAAELLGTSRSRIWRATKNGELIADKERVNGRKVWTVREKDLIRWSQSWLDSAELSVVSEQIEHQNEQSEQFERSRTELNERTELSERTERTELNSSEQSPSIEVYKMLVDRLTLSERRAVELELNLRQHRLLLAENAESLQEDRAKVLEVEARVEEALQEAEKAKLELESLKTELVSVKKENQSLWAEKKKRPWWKMRWVVGG